MSLFVVVVVVVVVVATWGVGSLEIVEFPDADADSVIEGPGREFALTVASLASDMVTSAAIMLGFSWVTAASVVIVVVVVVVGTTVVHEGTGSALAAESPVGIVVVVGSSGLTFFVVESSDNALWDAVSFAGLVGTVDELSSFEVLASTSIGTAGLMVVVVILLVSLRSNFVAVSICIGASFGASDSLDIDGLSDSWLIVFAAPSAGVTGADILVTSGEGSVFSFATVDSVLACFS